MAEYTSLSESPSNYVEWKIENFYYLRTKVNDSLESPRFSLGQANWYLWIYPKGESRYKSFGWIGVFLMKEESEINCPVAFRIGIKRADGYELVGLESEHTFKTMGDGDGTYKLIKRSTLLKTVDALAPDGSLTVFCNATFMYGPLIPRQAEVFASPEISPSPAELNETDSWYPSAAETNEAASWFQSPAETNEAASQTSSPIQPTGNVATQTSSRAVSTGEAALQSDGISTLYEDLKNMYISRSYTDITILVQNRMFSAHRSILAARSVVFASMFTHDLAEKSSGKVEITDCDPDSFEQFLLFLYTGKVDGVTASKAVHLYVTADKYDVEDLKEECVRCMVRDVSVDSFCDVIHLAAMYNDSDLLKATTNFFIDNLEAILPTAKWQDLLTENPLLCNELLIKVMKSKK